MKSKAMWLVVFTALLNIGLGNLALAQEAAAPKQVNGTVIKIEAGANELVMKADSGGEVKVTLAPKHALRKSGAGRNGFA